MIKRLKKPMLVTSANISNEPSLQRYKDVYDKLNGLIDGIIQNDANSDVSSTIVDLSGKDIKILREGKISQEEIMNCLK